MIHTTNAIESLHSMLRKLTQNRGSFPSNEACAKIMFEECMAPCTQKIPLSPESSRETPPHSPPEPCMNPATAASSISRAAKYVIAAGALTLISVILMTAYAGGNPPPATHPNDAGFQSAMIWLELIDTPAEAELVLGDAASEAGQALRGMLDRANQVDFSFMIGYSLFNAAAICFVYALNRRRDESRAADSASFFSSSGFLYVGLLMGVLMLVFDAIETQQLFRVTGAADPAALDGVGLLYVATRIKWAALFINCLLLGGGFAAFFRKHPAVLIGVVYILGGSLGLPGLLASDLRVMVEWGTNGMAIGWIATLVYAGIVARRGSS